MGSTEIELKIDFNAKHGKKILKQFKKDIAFAHSKASERVIKHAVNKAEISAANTLDYAGLNSGGTRRGGAPMTRGLAKKGLGYGLVRGRYPSRKEVQNDFKSAKGVSAEARVYIVNDKERSGSRSFDMINEMYPLVFGETVKKVNKFPTGELGVITPTSALMKGLSGRGRLKKLNKYGNIAGLKRHLVSLINATDSLGKIYLNVPLNNTNPRTKHLKPGLYFRGREISKGGTSKRRDGKLTRSARRVKKGRVRSYLVMLIAYHDHRKVKGIWDFPKLVIKTYEKTYEPNYNKALREAIESSFRQGRYKP